MAFAFDFCFFFSLLCCVTSSQPQLYFRGIKATTLTCNMEGFKERLEKLLALQIVKHGAGENGTDAVFATVDSSETLASFYLKKFHSSHNVSGKLQLDRRDAWLQVTILNVTEDVYGTYSCQVHYTDHPADNKHSTWKAELSLHSLMSEKRQTTGFTIDLHDTLAVKCISDGFSADDVYKMSITSRSNNRPIRVSWNKDETEPTCSPEFLSPIHKPPYLEACFREVRCSYQSDYVCEVSTLAGQTLQSPPKRLPLPTECLETDDKNHETTKTDDKNHETTTAFDRTTAGDGKSVLMVPIIVAVVVLFLGLFVLFVCRKRSRSKGSTPWPKDTEKNLDNDLHKVDLTKGKKKPFSLSRCFRRQSDEEMDNTENELDEEKSDKLSSGSEGNPSECDLLMKKGISRAKSENNESSETETHNSENELYGVREADESSSVSEDDPKRKLRIRNPASKIRPEVQENKLNSDSEHEDHVPLCVDLENDVTGKIKDLKRYYSDSYTEEDWPFESEKDYVIVMLETSDSTIHKADSFPRLPIQVTDDVNLQFKTRLVV